MKHGLEIREMTGADIPALASLMTELGYPTTIEEMRTRMITIGKQEDYKTFIADKKGEVAGMAGMLKIYFWEQSGWHIKIQAFVIKQSCRGQGIGAALMQACERWAKETGAVLIALNCGKREERKAAHKFYPKMGFECTSSGYKKSMKEK